MLNYFLKIYKTISIKQKFLLLFSVQIMIPLIFMGVMLYRNTRAIIEKNAIINTIEKLKTIETRVDFFTQNVIDISQDLLKNENVQNTLNEDRRSTTSYVSVARRQTQNLIRSITTSRKEVQAIILISTKNNRVESFDLNAGGTNPEIAAFGEEGLPYYAMLGHAKAQGPKPAWFLDTDSSGQIKDLYLIRMIYDTNSFNEIGLAVICVNREALKESYIEISKETIQEVNILSKEYIWVIGTNPDSQGRLEAYLKQEDSKKYDYQIDKKNNILTAYMVADDDNWVIMMESSLSKLNEELDRFRLLFVIITICTILILSIFSILMAMDIIDPINRLVEGIKKVEEENVHQEVIVDRNDELGYLSKCFNKMTKEIDILVNRVYKEQLTRKEAELKALQAQINPHFLFNTLESINWMAQLNNVPEIRDMVTSLGSIMEASIGKGNPLIPLKQELKYMDSYILIMKNRYGDRLSYYSDIDETLLGNQVPKLLLQPLIENAIYHGIDRMRKKGEIKLTIRKQEDTIYIEVMDNGKGMEKEEVDALNKKFREVADDYILVRHRKGIGLENVNGRIKLFFGQEYGLRVESEYESYTKMILTIPIND